MPWECSSDLNALSNVSFARGSVHWEGDHIRVVLKPKESRGITKEVEVVTHFHSLMKYRM